ncbi:MAG: hypothetical protein IKX97_03770, partial [Erysipelotrichaceae bacterium]|nr:hypothetical protein [Erysipelotrichaceae bacterium]
RPQYSRIEDDVYFFDCSRTQAFQYFSRFGSNATVIEPADLVEDLHRFYSSAERKYRNRNTDTSSEDSDLPFPE